MRVLFVGHAYLNREAQAKLIALTKLGLTIGLLSPSTWKPIDGLFHGKTLSLERPSDAISYFPANVFRSGHIASFLYSPNALISAIRRFQPEIVQVEQEVYSYAAAQSTLIAKLFGNKVAIFGWENLDRKLHFSQRISRKISLALADAVIAGNSAGANLIRDWHFPGMIVRMPQLGVDPEKFKKITRRSGNEMCIGFFGRMVAEKGGDLLILAFAKIADHYKQIRLQLVGRGPERDRWRRLSNRLGVDERVSWIDAVPHEQVSTLMNDIDILVVPSRSTQSWREQFGLVLAQAMCKGIPVIGARSGAIPEVIGREDLLFDEDDADGIAKLLMQLVESAEWRNSISLWVRQRALENFTNHAIANRLARIYSEILGDA